MKYYFAGINTTYIDILKAGNSTRGLLSYYDLGSRKDNGAGIDKFAGIDIFLDSGAFTAFTQNKVISVHDYILYLKTYGHKFHIYAGLDVIGDPEETDKNQKTMEEAGLHPIPTFHYNSDLKWLREYVEKYDYIALGGLVPLAKDKPVLKNWLNKCFKLLLPYILNKKLKVHGFGVGNPDVLVRYPFYSSDSTGWLGGEKFGDVTRWNPERFKFDDLGFYSDKDVYLKNDGCITWLENYKYRTENEIRQYISMENDITRLWASRGVAFI